jgi:hypothetical protein
LTSASSASDSSTCTADRSSIEAGAGEPGRQRYRYPLSCRRLKPSRCRGRAGLRRRPPTRPCTGRRDQER